MFLIEQLIDKKNNHQALSKAEIDYIVSKYTDGSISDDKMSLWLKSVLINDMTIGETLNYTDAMLKSGKTLKFSHLDGFVIDKHSTGGVGDKVSLILGPMLAACGCYIPMIAGRGLEHTGGTIDKLESIPGYKVKLSISQFIKNVETLGISIMSQTNEICPSDKKIYALRDISKTVSSFPLICGSIMSKKLAEGLDGLVLDIKVGNGAFMQTIKQANKLGNLLKTVGELHGIKVSICYTDMNQPLGYYAGIWCEIKESIDCLKGEGPKDLMDVVYHIGERALSMARIEQPIERLKKSISSGQALEIFNQMIYEHGSTIDILENINLYQPKKNHRVYANKDGYISSIDTLGLGLGLVSLGCGRINKHDKIDPSAGLHFYKKVGEKVKSGDLIFEYFYSRTNINNKTKLGFERCILISDEFIRPNKLIIN